jgi:hypothetical protein
MASAPVSTEPEEVPESEVEEEINGSQGDSVTVDNAVTLGDNFSDNAVTLGDNFSDNAGGAGDDVPPFEQEEKPAVKPAKTKPAKKEEKKPEVDDVDDFGDFV